MTDHSTTHRCVVWNVVRCGTSAWHTWSWTFDSTTAALPQLWLLGVVRLTHAEFYLALYYFCDTGWQTRDLLAAPGPVVGLPKRKSREKGHVISNKAIVEALTVYLFLGVCCNWFFFLSLRKICPYGYVWRWWLFTYRRTQPLALAQGREYEPGVGVANWCYWFPKALSLKSCVTGHVIAGLFDYAGTHPTPDPSHNRVQSRASGRSRRRNVSEARQNFHWQVVQNCVFVTSVLLHNVQHGEYLFPIVNYKWKHWMLNPVGFSHLDSGRRHLSLQTHVLNLNKEMPTKRTWVFYSKFIYFWFGKHSRDLWNGAQVPSLLASDRHLPIAVLWVLLNPL